MWILLHEILLYIFAEFTKNYTYLCFKLKQKCNSELIMNKNIANNLYKKKDMYPILLLKINYCASL